MDRKEKLLVACTLLIVVTLVGCTYWLQSRVLDQLNYVIQAIEQH